MQTWFIIIIVNSTIINYNTFLNEKGLQTYLRFHYPTTTAAQLGEIRPKTLCLNLEKNKTFKNREKLFYTHKYN